MKCRSFIVFCLASVGLLLGSVGARAQDLRVLDSTPAANASIDGRSTGFSVRFDRPVDHVRSVLVISRDGEVVETLRPRLSSAPDVLFARVGSLPPGKYKLHWRVRTMADAEIVEGDIPFTVDPDR